MTTFKDFSENGQLLSTREEVLNKSNIERYVLEHGEPRLAGYLDALNDMTKLIDQILYTRIDNNPGLNSNRYVQRELLKLLDEKQDFLANTKLDIYKKEDKRPSI